MKKWILLLSIVLLALVACAPGAEPESEISVVAASPEATEPPLAEAAAEPSPTVSSPPTAVLSPPTAVSSPPTAVPTNEPPVEPTAVPTDAPITEEPTEIPTQEPAAETAVIAGRLDDGAFFLGAPDAPVTMIDYSDFL
jgi:hypothetical protein